MVRHSGYLMLDASKHGLQAEKRYEHNRVPDFYTSCDISNATFRHTPASSSDTHQTWHKLQYYSSTCLSKPVWGELTYITCTLCLLAKAWMDITVDLEGKW